MAQMKQLEAIHDHIKALMANGFDGSFTVNLQAGQIQICRTHQFKDASAKPLTRIKELSDSDFYGKYTLNFRRGDDGASRIDSCEEEETIKV